MTVFLLALGAIIAIIGQYNVYLSILLSILFLALLIINKKELSAKNALIFIIVFLAFFLRTMHIQNNNYSILENKDGQYNIEIIKNISINGDFLKGEAIINDEKIIFNYKIKSKEEKRYFQTQFVGGTLSVVGNVEDIPSPKNYYDFDYKHYLARQGIFKKLIITDILSLKNGTFSNYRFKILNFRTKLIKNIENNVYFSRSGYFEALIYGYKNNLDIDDRKMYSDLGISHLLAISGLHISFLVALFYFFIHKFLTNRIYKDIVLITILVGYNILTGLQPSVLRASLMIILFIIFYKNNMSTLTSLLITFLILSFYNPFYIFEIGFQFSFFITFCLIMSSSFLANSKNKVEQLFKISFLCFLGGLPITISHFYYISYISIFSNIIIVPYFTFLLFPSVIFIFFSKIFLMAFKII